MNATGDWTAFERLAREIADYDFDAQREQDQVTCGTRTTQRRQPMSLHENVLEGTLKADGTLELDQKPSLSPGRVRVILQPAQAGTLPRRGLADVIDEIHRDQQARGFQGRSAAEIEATLREGEDEYEQRIRALLSQTQSGPRAGGS